MGEQGPQGLQGPIGVQGPQGVQGPIGPQGVKGEVPLVSLTSAEYAALPVKSPDTMYTITDGADRTVLAGTVPPTAADGINGDFHINSATWQVSGPKMSNAWPPPVSMIGPAGALGGNITQDAKGQLNVKSSSNAGFGKYGIVLSDIDPTGWHVVLQFFGNRLYMTDLSGNPTPLMLGSWYNPYDASTLKAESGKWTLSAGQFLLPGDPTVPLQAATKQYTDQKWTRWTGNQAAYDAIGTKDPNTLYVVT